MDATYEGKRHEKKIVNVIYTLTKNHMIISIYFKKLFDKIQHLFMGEKKKQKPTLSKLVIEVSFPKLLGIHENSTPNLTVNVRQSAF